MSHQSGSLSGATKRAKRWGKISASVWHDRELSLRAKVVFGELSFWAGRGSVVSRGQRAIAGVLGMSRASVARALVELSERRHIDVWLTKHGAKGKGRSKYLLRSPVYWEREEKVEGAGGEVVGARVQDGVLQRRLVDVGMKI